MLMASLLLMI